MVYSYSDCTNTIIDGIVISQSLITNKALAIHTWHNSLLMIILSPKMFKVFIVINTCDPYRSEFKWNILIISYSQRLRASCIFVLHIWKKVQSVLYFKSFSQRTSPGTEGDQRTSDTQIELIQHLHGKIKFT